MLSACAMAKWMPNTVSLESYPVLARHPLKLPSIAFSRNQHDLFYSKKKLPFCSYHELILSVLTVSRPWQLHDLQYYLKG